MDYRRVVFEFLKKRDGNFCYYCGRPPEEIDHILSKTRFPQFKHDMANLRLICKKCNVRKGNLTPAEYVNWRVLRRISRGEATDFRERVGGPTERSRGELIFFQTE